VDVVFFDDPAFGGGFGDGPLVMIYNGISIAPLEAFFTNDVNSRTGTFVS